MVNQTTLTRFDLKDRRSGIALFFILCAIAIVSIIVYGMVSYMRGEVFLTENYVDSASAFLLAEAGVEEALFTIRSQMNNPENPFYKMVTKSDEGQIEVDLAQLEGKVPGVEPIIEGGSVRAVVSWKRDLNIAQELIAQGLPPELAREGLITITSRGDFKRTKRQVEVKKAMKGLRVRGPLPGNSVGMIAPEHALYLNKAHHEAFQIKPFDFWDPWGFTVKGGKMYVRDGAKIDLAKWIMLTKMRRELDNPWLDMGIGWTGWTGGGDFSEVNEIEYTNAPVTRRYNKWMGLLNWPLRRKVDHEKYHSRTRQVDEYEPAMINLYTADVYRRLANRLVDPEKNPSHGKYFTDVNFRQAFGLSEVTYRNVIPLYGWGDWRNVPERYHRFLGNPTKGHDTSRPVEINGLTYIKGDVFIEGWVKGRGLLVVEGNVYIGGDILTLPDDAGGHPALGIIALREPSDTSVESPRTGRIIYKPHHDSDWSRLGITHPFRNYSPRLEGSFYAQGGLELDTDSKAKKLINIEIVGNLATDFLDRSKMPNDVKITYFNWQEILAQSTYDYVVERPIKYTDKYELSILREIVSWREVPATL